MSTDRHEDLPEACRWEYQEGEGEGCVWAGDCGVMWEFSYGSPKDNDVRFCPRCGRPLVQMPFVPEDEEEEVEP